MITTWPAAIRSRSEIELRIGLLRHLFISKSSDWLVASILACLPLPLAGLVFFFCFTSPNPGLSWIGGVVALVISAALFGLAVWYRGRRKFFCLCDNGCAFGDTLAGIPQILPWLEVQTIQIEEDAYLKVEDHSVFGFKVSSTMEEASRRWMHIKSGHDAIRFKLGEFPKPQDIVEQVLEHSKDKEIALDHARVESPELAEVKSGQASGKNLGKTTYYAGGVIVIIIFIVLRIVLRLNK